MLKTPIIVAVIVGALLNGFRVPIPDFVDTPLEMMGQVAIPLMLFSLGVRLTRLDLKDVKLGLIVAVLCPVVGVALALLLIAIIPLSPLHQSILILFGALPPAVVNYMLSEQYDCEPDQVASIVIIGNLASVISLPIALTMVL